jgi:formate/nitrite transporter FocA (FNT family)
MRISILASDLEHEPYVDEASPTQAKKLAKEILRHELAEAHEAFELPLPRLFISGLSAGLDVGFSLWLMAIFTTIADGSLSPPVHELLLASMYSFGFIVVVLGRSELFTEQTSLAVLLVLDGRATLASLARVWTIVFVSNLVGVAGSAALAVWIGPQLGVIERAAFSRIAEGVVSHPSLTILLSGIMAGWMMGLLSWLVAAGRDTISQIVIVWMITTAIGLGHLHHSVVGSAEVLGGVYVGGVTLGDFGRFALWTTIGNAVGGTVFVALLKYGHTKGLPKM